MPISLRISGRRQRQAGFSPLVNVGIFPSVLDQDLDRNFALSKRTFVLRHCHEYIAYILYDQMVKSFDTNAPGLLTIALTIPRRERLADGRSPYTLLMEVYRQFQVLYMDFQSDGYYLFKDAQADSNIFKAMVDGYALESYSGRYIEMNAAGSLGALSVPESQMEAFFRDTQYPDFAGFKEIQIAPELISTPSLARLEIPRKERWEVFINGVSTGKYIDADNPTCYVKAKDTEDYEFPEVIVNLFEVLNADGGEFKKDGVRCTADYKSGHILVNQQGQEIMYKVTVVLPEEQWQKEYFLSHKRLDDLQILLGQEEVFDGTAISANQFNQNRFTFKDRNSSAQYKILGSARLDKPSRIVKICLTLNRNNVHESYRPSLQDSDNVRDKTGVGRNSVSSATEQGQKRYEELQAKYDQLNNNYKKIEDNNNSLYAEKRSLNRKFKIAVVGCVLLLMWGLCLLYINRNSEDKNTIDLLMAERSRADVERATFIVDLEKQKKEKDSLSNALKQARDSIKLGTNGAGANIKSGSNGSDNTTKTYNVVLNAVRPRWGLKYVQGLPGYTDLSNQQKLAIVWLLDTTTSKSNRKGKFNGNQDCDYDDMKAREIDKVRDKYLNETGITDLQSLDNCYKDIMEILNKSDNVKESNGGK